jgi:hypothetical protein
MISRDKSKSLIKYGLEKLVGERDLGEIQNFVKLKKQAAPSAKKDTDAFLIQTVRGVWIIDTEKEDTAKPIDLWKSDGLKYHSKMTGDSIEVDGQTFRISPGDGSPTRSALAVGKILHEYNFTIDSLHSPEFDSGFVERSDRLWNLWLQAMLKPDEHLLALLETSTKFVFEKSILDDSSEYCHFVLTTHRNLLVAISEVGDVDLVELPKRRIEIEHSIGRGTVSCGDHKWAATVTNESLYKKISAVAGLSPADSLRAIGFIIWQEKGLKKIGSVRKIFEILQHMDGTTPIDSITGTVFKNLKNEKIGSDDASGPIDHDLVLKFREIRKSESSSEYIVQWLQQWNFPVSVGEDVLKHLMNTIETSEDARWTLPFHRYLHEMRAKTIKKLVPLILFDIAMVEHLILAQEYEPAKAMIEQRLAQLPSEELLDLLPDRDEDITESPGLQRIRIQLLELLDISKQNLNEENFDTVFSLANYKPFEVARIEQLENFKNKQIAERARAVKQLLSRQGLQTETGGTLPELSRVSSLSNKDLDLLRHPMTRKGNILGKLQGALAKTTTPDFNHMRQFCKKATTTGEQLIIDIVGQTCLALGLRVVPAYLSHGEKSVGVRAFEAEPNFILIGSKHVETDSDYFLSPLELTFAIAAELTHLKFKHARVTSRAVIDGTLAKGMSAMEAVSVLLPFLKFIPVDKLLSKRKTYQVIRSVVPLNLLKKIYRVEDGRQLMSKVGTDISPLLAAGSDSIKKLKKGISATTNQIESIAHSKEEDQRFVAVDEDVSEDLSPSNDKLVVAHRVMQLTADRAGLVFCGNISAAVRSMFLTSLAYQPELYIAQKNDLVTCLKRHDEKGNYILQDLAIRIGSLISFFLSDDYQHLRQKITGTLIEPDLNTPS